MVQNMTLTEDQVIGLLTYKDATEWEKRFQEPYYRALSKMAGVPYFGHVGGCPSLFRMITAKWVYGVALPDYVYESVKKVGLRVRKFTSTSRQMPYGKLKSKWWR